MNSETRRRRFLRLETDDEFRQRIPQKERYNATIHYGEKLDDYAWEHCQIQRKMVEDEA